jgi:hypothetical protein
VYITGDPNISSDIKIGDSIIVKYIIDANGSITAIDIEKTETNDHLVEPEVRATQVIVGEEENEGTYSVEPTKIRDHTDERSTASPENQKTPEPTEEQEHPP